MDPTFASSGKGDASVSNYISNQPTTRLNLPINIHAEYIL